MPRADHAAEAARHILAQLCRQGKRAQSVEEAIRRGYLTDLQWCEVLDEFRERYGHVHSARHDERKGRVA